MGGAGGRGGGWPCCTHPNNTQTTPQLIHPIPHFHRSNTLVCDTDREAKALAFQGPERHKVVALDGTLISRAGLITGGLSGGMERRAARFDDAALASLKAERQRCADGLASLQSARDAERVVEGLRAEAARLKREVELKQADLEASRKRLAEKEAEAGALDAERTKREPEAAKLRATVDVAKDKAAAALERIHEVEDRVFADFSKKASKEKGGLCGVARKGGARLPALQGCPVDALLSPFPQVGVANVRAHMEQHAAAVAEKARRRMQLAQQASKIKHQLSYERRRDLAAPAAAVAATMRLVQTSGQREYVFIRCCSAGSPSASLPTTL